VTDDELAGRQTILERHRRAVADVQVRYARGTGIHDGTSEEIVAAAEAGEIVRRRGRRPGRAIRADRRLDHRRIP
jgi:hypothetical protein